MSVRDPSTFRTSGRSYVPVGSINFPTCESAGYLGICSLKILAAKPHSAKKSDGGRRSYFLTVLLSSVYQTFIYHISKPSYEYSARNSSAGRLIARHEINIRRREPVTGSNEISFKLTKPYKTFCGKKVTFVPRVAVSQGRYLELFQSLNLKLKQFSTKKYAFHSNVNVSCELFPATPCSCAKRHSMGNQMHGSSSTTAQHPLKNPCSQATNFINRENWSSL